MSEYRPLYAEKRCIVCGYWRGQHIGASSNDVEMKCPINPAISAWFRTDPSFVAGEMTGIAYRKKTAFPADDRRKP